MKQILFITTWAGALCGLLCLTACGDELEELGYVPAAIGDNSHTAAHHDEDTGGKQNGSEGAGDYAGTLADQLAESYTGLLTVSINGESSNPAVQTISIEKVDGTHINFMLKNFMLSNEDTTMPVGTIRLENIELQPSGEAVAFSIDQSINIAAGDAEGYDEWFGPMLGPVPVKLQGVASPAGMDIDIDIDMKETLNQIIHVDFIANEQ